MSIEAVILSEDVSKDRASESRDLLLPAIGNLSVLSVQVRRLSFFSTLEACYLKLD